MAIYASVRYRSLKAGVTHQKLQLSASVRKAAVAVSQQNVVAEISSRQMSAAFSFVKLMALSNWQKLYLHDVHVNAERTIYFFSDSLDFVDAPVMAVGKGLSDQFGFVSDSATLNFGKALQSTLPLIDSTRLSVGATAFDAALFADSQYFDVGKGIADAVSFTENVHTLLTFIRQFSSLVGMAEAISVATNKPQDDNFGFSDLAANHPNKEVSGSTVSFADTQTFHANAGPLSGFATFDQMVLTRQPFNFVFTPVGATTSVTGELEDSFGFADTLAFSGSIGLQDFFALDDFAQVNKDVDGVKNNFLGLSDVLAASLQKVNPDQTVSLTEEHLIALSKPVSDSIMVADLLTSHASKSALDTTTLNDAATLSPRIGKSDSTTIVDSLDVEHVVTGALLNQALIGNMILNAE